MYFIYGLYFTFHFSVDFNLKYRLIWDSTCIMHFMPLFLFFLEFHQHEVKGSHSNSNSFSWFVHTSRKWIVFQVKITLQFLPQVRSSYSFERSLWLFLMEYENIVKNSNTVFLILNCFFCTIVFYKCIGITYLN